MMRMASDEIKIGPVIGGYGTVALSFVQDFTTDITPPEVIGVTPLNNGNSRGLNAPVVWVMSKSIMVADVIPTYFHVIDSSSGATVPGKLSVNYIGTAITFTPTNPWIQGRVYLPRAEVGVHDLSGNQLALAYGTKFTATAS
jgi:hypothetical protein